MSADIPNHHVPHRASTIAMAAFLVALGMLFAASMLGYVYIRVSGDQPAGMIRLPSSLWVSTLMILACSYTMHRALAAIRREKQDLFRIYLSATVVFAGIFVFIQTPAMLQLLHEHQAATLKHKQDLLSMKPAVPNPSINEDEIIPGNRSVPYYGLVMVLILVHALHVVGGIIALGVVAFNGYRGRYDHEHHLGVRNCVLYWHFLDVVWLIMFTIISAFR